jgi:hypothetical protein
MNKKLHILTVFLLFFCGDLISQNKVGAIEKDTDVSVCVISPPQYYQMLLCDKLVVFVGSLDSSWREGNNLKIKVVGIETIIGDTIFKEFEFVAESSFKEEVFINPIRDKKGQVINRDEVGSTWKGKYSKGEPVLIFTNANKGLLFEEKSFALKESDSTLLPQLRLFNYAREEKKWKGVVLNFPYERIEIDDFHTGWEIYTVTKKNEKYLSIAFNFHSFSNKPLRIRKYSKDGQLLSVYELDESYEKNTFYTNYQLGDNSGLPIKKSRCNVAKEGANSCLSTTYEYYGHKKIKSLISRGILNDCKTITSKTIFDENGRVIEIKNGIRASLIFRENGVIKELSTDDKVKFLFNENGEIESFEEQLIY